MNYLKELAKAIISGDKSAINEASLGRVYQHVKKDASDSFAIITAYRGQYTKSKNKSRNKELESQVRSLGLGFFKLQGYWLECQDDSMEYADCPDDMKVPSVEEALFIPNISMKDAIRLGKNYDQDAIIYQGSETNDKVELVSKSGSSIMKLGDFHPNKIAQAFSKVKGRTFTFEGFRYNPTGMMSNMVFKQYLKEFKSRN